MVRVFWSMDKGEKGCPPVHGGYRRLSSAKLEGVEAWGCGEGRAQYREKERFLCWFLPNFLLLFVREISPPPLKRTISNQKLSFLHLLFTNTPLEITHLPKVTPTSLVNLHKNCNPSHKSFNRKDRNFQEPSRKIWVLSKRFQLKIPYLKNMFQRTLKKPLFSKKKKDTTASPNTCFRDKQVRLSWPFTVPIAICNIKKENN